MAGLMDLLGGLLVVAGAYGVLYLASRSVRDEDD
jgi:hypothetical protein